MLFDLSKDEMELNDISLQKPEILQELQTRYQQWSNDLAAPKWTDAHMQNVRKEETNVQNIRIKSLSKKERGNNKL